MARVSLVPLLIGCLILSACGASPREPVEAKPPELIISGGASVGLGGKISAPASEGLPPSWTETLTGATAPVAAASRVDAKGGYLERLIALEEAVAEGVEQGKFTEIDLAQVRARRARAEARLAQSIGSLGQAKARYNRIVGP